MMHNMQEAVGNPKLGFMKDAASFSRELLATLVTQDIRYRNSDEPEKEKLNANLDSMNNLLSSQATAFVQEDL